ncbi:SAM-dependent methyltransferase [Bacteriovoracaceae bacterium]|nr:SAM-dependent methyltransferase [Bacteriovoracaceae bacterium]
MQKGKLILVATPIGDYPLRQDTISQLEIGIEKNAVFVVEELKIGRRRWIHWGLPRSVVDDFRCLNEHNAKKESYNIYDLLASGRDVFLMSDCGLPAFYDPGQELVNICHERGAQVTATAFDNSFALAIALSGFPHQQFFFAGHLPAKDKVLRQDKLTKLLENPDVVVLMDTPYRLVRLIEEVYDHPASSKRHYFLGMDLGTAQEECLRGNINSLRKKIGSNKREFVLVMGPLAKNK